jgi:hypothetical protein
MARPRAMRNRGGRKMKRENWNKQKETSEFDIAFAEIMKGKDWTKDGWEKRKCFFYFMQNSKEFIQSQIFGNRRNLKLSFEDMFIIISTYELSGCIDWDEETGYHFIETNKENEDFYMDALAKFTGHSEIDLITKMKRYRKDKILISWDMNETEKTVMEIVGAMK